MKFVVSNAPKVRLITEHGIGRRVFIDGNEIRMVTDIDLTYGVNDLPKVKITLMAEVEVVEAEER